MKNLLTITNDKGRQFNVKVLFKGDKYGLKKCLISEREKPIVEFYDATYAGAVDKEGKPRFDPEGQFVSSYYWETLCDHNRDCGIDLCGYEPVWKIDGKALMEIKMWIARHMEMLKLYSKVEQLLVATNAMVMAAGYDLGCQSGEENAYASILEMIEEML